MLFNAVRYILTVFIFSSVFSCSNSEKNVETNNSIVTHETEHSIRPNDSGLFQQHTNSSQNFSQSRPITPTIDDLSKQIYQALINNDSASFLSLLPSEDEVYQLIDKAKLPDNVKKESKNNFPKKRMEEIKKAKTNFIVARQAMLTTASSGGISGIQFLKTHAPVVMLPAEFEQAPELFMVYSTGGKQWALLIKDCIHTPAGWRASGEISFYNEWREKQ